MVMPFILKRAFYFVVDNWKGIAVFAGVCLAFVVMLLMFKACDKPPKLEQKEVIKAQQAIAKEDRKEMVEILAASDVKEQGIDNSIKAAEQATEDAKKSYSDYSNADLADELNRRAQQ